MDYFVLDLQDEHTKREVDTKLSLVTTDYRIAKRDVVAVVSLHCANLEMRQQLGKLPRFGLRLAFTIDGYVDDDETYQLVPLDDQQTKRQHDTYAWYQLDDDEVIAMIKAGALSDDHFNERLQDHLQTQQVTMPVSLRTQEYQLSDYDYLAVDSEPGLIQLQANTKDCDFHKILTQTLSQLTTEYQQQPPVIAPVVENKPKQSSMFVDIDHPLVNHDEKDVDVSKDEHDQVVKPGVKVDRPLTVDDDLEL